MKKPPVNDKGALLTPAPFTPQENRVLIDFCGFTVKVEDPQEVLTLCGFDPSLFVESGGGGMGYRKSMRFGGIVCFYEGGNDGMGCHVSMAGQGCREYENLNASLGPDCWHYLFLDVLSAGGTFSRLDVAIDNVDGRLSLARLNHAVRVKSIRGRYKRSMVITDESLSRTEETAKSFTRYFGSMQSRVFMRFYDKAAEQELKNNLSPGTLGRWIRCELVMKDERANEAVKYLVEGMEIGKLAVGVINNYLAVVKIVDLNISRCPLRRWWQTWLGSIEKIKLTVQKHVKTICHVKEHIRRQYAASIAMIRKFDGVARFHDFITEIIDDGRVKMGRRHDKILLNSGYAVGVPLSDLPF